jgi:hypothetical protein
MHFGAGGGNNERDDFAITAGEDCTHLEAGGTRGLLNNKSITEESGEESGAGEE